VNLQRTASPKPAKGSGLIERHTRRLEIRHHERVEKDKARKRDRRGCRWPFCEHKALKPRIEVAHLDDKGMGGDHSERTTADRLICLCFLHHQGAKSLHSGDLLIAPQTELGTDGPCMFIELKPRYRSITETAVGIPERVDHD
jgi:hypothetical protein